MGAILRWATARVPGLARAALRLLVAMALRPQGDESPQNVQRRRRLVLGGSPLSVPRRRGGAARLLTLVKAREESDKVDSMLFVAHGRPEMLRDCVIGGGAEKQLARLGIGYTPRGLNNKGVTSFVLFSYDSVNGAPPPITKTMEADRRSSARLAHISVVTRHTHRRALSCPRWSCRCAGRWLAGTASVCRKLHEKGGVNVAGKRPQDASRTVALQAAARPLAGALFVWLWGSFLEAAKYARQHALRPESEGLDSMYLEAHCAQDARSLDRSYRPLVGMSAQTTGARWSCPSWGRTARTACGRLCGAASQRGPRRVARARARPPCGARPPEVAAEGPPASVGRRLSDILRAMAFASGLSTRYWSEAASAAQMGRLCGLRLLSGDLV